MELDFFMKILVASILGGIIGLERDISHKNEKEQFAGLRSYALISMLGTIGVVLDSIFKTNYIFIISLFLIFSTIVICAYLYATFKNNDIGITSELTAILTYFIGVFAGLGNIKIAIIFTISLTLIISKYISESIIEIERIQPSWEKISQYSIPFHLRKNLGSKFKKFFLGILLIKDTVGFVFETYGAKTIRTFPTEITII